MAPSVSVVLPAFNAADYIRQSVDELLAFMDASDIQGEVIVVDDGSTDATAEHVPTDGRVQVIRSRRNRGKGAAVRTGILHAGGSVRVFTDAELPYGCEPIASAIFYICERGFHAVVGDRTLPGSSYQHERPLRRAVSEVASFTFRTLVTGGIYDTQCGFKAFRGDVAEELFHLCRVDGFAADVELLYLLLKYRLDIKRIPVRLRYNAGSSVHVIRDSARAALDIGRMRFNWGRGAYRSERLAEILAADSAPHTNLA